MARLDKERQLRLEPKRMEVAISKIEEMGYQVTQVSDTHLKFDHHMGHMVNYFPYSGWATGSSIKDGRGLKRLLRQL